VTVTDPDVTRYFMTIPEACQLILQASAIGAQQAVYTLDMGEAVSIRMLAEQMIRLAGKQPGKDIAIEYTGLRPGEKLHETLFHVDERYSATVHPKILQALPRSVSGERVEPALQALREAAASYDLDRLAASLRAAVPEFNPSADDADNARESTIVAFPARRARQQ
jgi:FlaA1/EpsC-like NDP-sugar epimerase